MNSLVPETPKNKNVFPELDAPLDANQMLSVG